MTRSSRQNCGRLVRVALLPGLRAKDRVGAAHTREHPHRRCYGHVPADRLKLSVEKEFSGD